MTAFGQLQAFAYPATDCILTVNERLLSAKSGHSRRSSIALLMHAEEHVKGYALCIR